MQRSKTVGRGVFGGAVALALAFGASGALAAPGPVAASTSCTGTWAAKCYQICVDWGYSYGYCDDSSPGTYGTCHCVLD